MPSSALRSLAIVLTGRDSPGARAIPRGAMVSGSERVARPASGEGMAARAHIRKAATGAAADVFNPKRIPSPRDSL